MPDRGKFWPPVPDWSVAAIRRHGLDIVVARAETIWLVSGDLPKFLARHHDGADCTGHRDACGGDRYALRLAPDRLLFVRRAAAQAAPETHGWSNDGVALTDMSDGILLFDVTGPSALDVMALGAEYDFAAKPASPTKSAAMLFAGLKVWMARIAGGWRLHVERSYAAALWQWLEHATQDHTAHGRIGRRILFAIGPYHEIALPGRGHRRRGGRRQRALPSGQARLERRRADRARRADRRLDLARGGRLPRASTPIPTSRRCRTTRSSSTSELESESGQSMRPAHDRRRQHGRHARALGMAEVGLARSSRPWAWTTARLVTPDEIKELCPIVRRVTGFSAASTIPTKAISTPTAPPIAYAGSRQEARRRNDPAQPGARAQAARRRRLGRGHRTGHDPSPSMSSTPAVCGPSRSAAWPASSCR